MLITNIENFVANIPTAAGTEWSAIEPFLYQAENELIGLFWGDDLYEHLQGDADSKIQMIAIRLFCLQAYEYAIPFVDLIQTNNGFAVVKNSNQAPASKERVERLRQWISSQIYSNADLLVQLIMQTPAALEEWSKFSLFNQLTDCLFLTGNDFGQFATFAGSKRQALIENKNKLITWQVNVLEKIVSAPYLAKIITAVRTHAITPDMEKVMRLCKMILGKLYEGNENEAIKLSHALSNLLDENLAIYTDYAASAEYALRVAPKYENRSDHSTFFFG